MTGELLRASSLDALYRSAAEIVASAAVDAVKARGTFTVALRRRDSSDARPSALARRPVRRASVVACRSRRPDVMTLDQRLGTIYDECFEPQVTVA